MAISKSTVKSLESKLAVLGRKHARLMAKRRLLDNEISAIDFEELEIRKSLITYYNQNN